MPYSTGSTSTVLTEHSTVKKEQKKKGLYTMDDYYINRIGKEVEKTKINPLSQTTQSTARIMKEENFDKKEFSYSNKMIGFKKGYWFGGDFNHSNIEKYLDLQREEMGTQNIVFFSSQESSYLQFTI